MAASKKPIWFLYSVLLFNQIISALAFPAAKIGLNEVEPLIYAAMRFTICSVVYIPILLVLRKNGRIPAKDHLRIFIIGLTIIFLNQVLFLVGQSMTSASHSSLLFATIPVFIYIMAIVFLKETASWRRTAGIVIAVAGVYIILSGGRVKFGSQYLFGDLLVLTAAIAWAAATVMAKPLAIKYGAFRVIGTALVYGSLVYIPFGIYEAVNYDMSSISWRGWLSILYLAIIVSIVAYVLWYWVLKYMEASRVAIVQNLQPIIAAGVAAVVLSESIGLQFVIGGIIVLTGVIITELK
jgi:drug/metabolite transporter (DMT)-like permease